MMKFARAALVAGALLMTASCASDLVTGGPLIRDGAPIGAIDIGNASGGQINVVLISACSASTYGLNRLPSGMAIPAGGSYRFQVSAGCWDVAAGSTAAMVEGRQRLNVAPGQATRVNFH
ncbi:hypothetical protein [Terricaulis sp.]|uniref:hypothetical protein n=1 Tax=Terricaulis sp. TaxID=2768686 RepID=UPI002AC79117|nr:hypothetical protein [Terricaulis sp.]MDZ4690275.1 hypothetical protein [Terricaulis sp.]